MITTLISDARLVQQARAGNPRSIEELVVRHQKKAFAVAHAIISNAADPQDVVQEATLLALKNLDRLERNTSFRPWFLTIVRNVARKELRRRSPPASLTQETPSAEPDAANRSEIRELNDRLWSEVQRLPANVREAVFLFYYEGESVRQVAKAQGTTSATAKKRLQTGRDLLRNRLWRRFEAQLRDMLPSTRTWKKKGRQTTLLLLGSLPVGRTTAAVAKTLTTSSTIHGSATLLGGAIVTKKAVGIAIAVVAVCSVGVSVLTMNNDSTHDERATREASRLRSELETLRRQYKDTRSQLQRSRTTIRNLEKTISDQRLAIESAGKTSETATKDGTEETSREIAGLIDLSGLAVLFAENIDTLQIREEGPPSAETSERMSKFRNGISQFEARIKAASPRPFFDDSIRGQLIRAIVSESLGLTKKQQKKLNERLPSTADVAVDGLTPLERYGVRRSTIMETWVGVEEILSDDQLEYWPALSEFSEHLFDGGASHYTYGVDQEDAPQVVVRDLRRIYALDDGQVESILPFVDEFIDVARDIVYSLPEDERDGTNSRLGLGLAPGVMEQFVEAQLNLEEQILPKLTEGQADRYSKQLPTVLRFRSGESIRRRHKPSSFLREEIGTN